MTVRIPSGTTDQYLYFKAVDITDLTTPETGLSGFTVYRSRNGGALTAWTTPTTAELSSANAPGWYSLLLDEDTTIGAGNTTEVMLISISHASMAPVGLEIEIFRPIVTEGNTLTIESDGMAHADLKEWLGVAPLALSSQRVQALTVALSNGSIVAATFGSGAIDAAAVAADVATELNAPILAVLGALADAAADGDVTTTDTIIAYIKQLINILMGAPGIVTFPASTTPGNGVSLAEVIRQIYDEVAGLNGGALVDAAGIRSAVGLAAANLDTQLSTIDDLLDTEIPAIKAVTDALPDAGALTTIQADLDNMQTRLPAALVGGRIDASVGAMAAGVLTASALDTTAIDEIWAKAMTDLAAIPGINASIFDGLTFLFEMAKHRMTQNATTLTLYKDNSVTALGSAAVSDNGVTLDRGKVG